MSAGYPWVPTHKGNRVGRELADMHYTRQSPGHPMWTRPGYNYVLLLDGEPKGRAVWVWWRPKWEAGQERKDGLRCLECTIFRREEKCEWVASDLVVAAIAALERPEAVTELRLAAAGTLRDGLITGVGSSQTRRRRSKRKEPGACFREVGWVEFDHKKGRADVWLRAP